MLRLKRIVCATDFSKSSARALDYAITIARWVHASVTVLHVLPPASRVRGVETDGHSPPLPPCSDGPEEARLDMPALSEHETRGLSIAPIVVEGDAVAEIVRFVETEPTDLLVVGTNGRSGLQRYRLGSVTERLLRRTSCPILTVPPRMRDATPTGPVFKHIVCAVDFSRSSMHALEFGASVADLTHATLTMLHVFEPIPECDNASLRAAAMRHLASVARGPLHDVTRVTSVLEVGKPGPMILEVAEKEAADLIVLGVGERSASQSFFLGSTINHVVRRSTCAVLPLES